MSPEDVYNKLLDNNGPNFLPFRDAAFGPCSFHLYLLDCFKAVNKVLFPLILFHMFQELNEKLFYRQLNTNF